MRKFLVVILTSLAFFSTQAQSRLGFRMGYHSSSTTYMNATNVETSPKRSFDLSVFGDIRFNKIVYLQPGLTLTDKSFYLYNQSSNFNYTITPVIIELPVHLVTKFQVGKIKPFLGAGGFMDIGLSGNIATEDYITYNGSPFNDSHKISWGNDASKDDFRRVSYGLSFIGGAELNEHLSLNLTYSRTLSNILPQGISASARNQTISLSVGIIL